MHEQCSSTKIETTLIIITSEISAAAKQPHQENTTGTMGCIHLLVNAPSRDKNCTWSCGTARLGNHTCKWRTQDSQSSTEHSSLVQHCSISNVSLVCSVKQKFGYFLWRFLSIMTIPVHQHTSTKHPCTAQHTKGRPNGGGCIVREWMPIYKKKPQTNRMWGFKSKLRDYCASIPSDPTSAFCHRITIRDFTTKYWDKKLCKIDTCTRYMGI